MCASCGCGKLHDDHDDDRHITIEDLEDAAAAADIPVAEVAQNIQEAVLTGAEQREQMAS